MRTLHSSMVCVHLYCFVEPPFPTGICSPSSLYSTPDKFPSLLSFFSSFSFVTTSFFSTRGGGEEEGLAFLALISLTLGGAGLGGDEALAGEVLPQEAVLDAVDGAVGDDRHTQSTDGAASHTSVDSSSKARKSEGTPNNPGSQPSQMDDDTSKDRRQERLAELVGLKAKGLVGEENYLKREREILLEI